jgi:Cupredoxin-like domain
MVHRSRARLAVAFLLSASLATPGLAQQADFILTIKDHQFSPTRLEIPANTKVKLIVRNADPTAEEFESTELHREKVIAGGTEGIVYVGPLKPGTYEFFGDFNPKTARGQLVAK